MEEIAQRIQQLEALVQQAGHQAQQAEQRAAAAEAQLQQQQPRGGVDPARLVDTKLLTKPSVFKGSDAEWQLWAFKFRAYCGAVDPKLLEAMQRAEAAADMRALRNASLTAGEQATSTQLYYLLVLLLDSQALATVKPVTQGEGFVAWRALVDRFQPKRPGRFAGLLQDLLHYTFPVVSIESALDEFEYGMSRYEQESGDRISDNIKLAILQRGMTDEQMRQHLVLHAGRLNTWAIARDEVRNVL
eukprot:5712331-Amphidinium_carterae.1